MQETTVNVRLTKTAKDAVDVYWMKTASAKKKYGTKLNLYRQMFLKGAEAICGKILEPTEDNVEDLF